MTTTTVDKPEREQRNGDADLDDIEAGGGVSFRPASVPSTQAPSKRFLQEQAARDAQKNAEEYEQVLGNLDIKPGAGFKITLVRDQPKEDPETGMLLEGWCGTYEDARLTREEIAEEHGGGKYRAMIYGPKTDGSRGLITTQPIVIPGFPIPPKQRRRSVGANTGGGKQQDAAAIVDRMAAASKEQLETFMAMAGKSGMDPVLSGILSKALDPTTQQTAAADAARVRDDEWRRERQARDEERKREQKERDEERKLAREDADRKEAAAKADRQAELERIRDERKHDLELLKLQLEKERVAAENQAKLQIAHAEAQAKLQIEAMKAQSEAASRAHELQLKTLEAQREGELKNTLTMQKQLQEMNNSHALLMQKANETSLQQIQANAQQQSQFLMAQLSAQKGGTKDLMEAFAFFERVRGDDGEEDEPVVLRAIEKGFEGLGKVAPGLFAAAGVGFGANNAKQRQLQQQNPQQNQQTTAEVEPGSVAVIDEGRRKKQLRRRPQPTPQNQQAVQDAQIVDTATEGDPTVKAGPNELTDYVFPSAPPGTPYSEDLAELLIKNFDLAVQKQMPANEIVEKIAKRFPPAVVEYLAALPVDLVLGTMKASPAMQGWAINTAYGEQRIREVYKLIKGK